VVELDCDCARAEPAATRMLASIPATMGTVLISKICVVGGDWEMVVRLSLRAAE